MKKINENMATGQKSVATSATLIAPQRNGRDMITIVNHGTATIYLGGPDVTALTGVLLPGAVGASFTLETTDAVYGIASATQVISYVETF